MIITNKNENDNQAGEGKPKRVEVVWVPSQPRLSAMLMNNVAQ